MSLTLYFIAEPPNYQFMACHLAASIRMHMPRDIVLIGYCPEQKRSEVDPNVEETLRRLRCEIRTFQLGDQFETPYPQGNKLLAALEPKETDFSAFLDTDMLFVQDCVPEEFVAPGRIGVVPSTSMRWSGQEVWDQVYAAFDLPLPLERIRMTRDKRQPVVPYFNAGLVVIDERIRDETGRNFAEVWLETAQRLDALPEMPGKRPYLDQISLPLAILRSGSSWNILHERYNFSIGGIMRGKRIDPVRDDVTLLHYRKGAVLRESGLNVHAREALATQAGTRRVNWVFMNSKPSKEGDPQSEEPSTPENTPQLDNKVADAAAEKPVPDQSKAMAAAVTFDEGNHDTLERWLAQNEVICGRENIFILSKEVEKLTAKFGDDLNLVALPETATAPDAQQKWQGLSHFVSGLTFYYNWVICTRPSETLVSLDEDSADILAQLRHWSRAQSPPRFLVPMPFSLRRTADGGTHLISDFKRARPCIVRGRLGYVRDGSGATPRHVSLDKDIALIDLDKSDEAVASTQSLEAFDVMLVWQSLRKARKNDTDGSWFFDDSEPLPPFKIPDSLAENLQIQEHI
ncbi:MAG: hypothetical protein AAF755_07405 [Pseudomonadota bacterium]